MDGSFRQKINNEIFDLNLTDIYTTSHATAALRIKFNQESEKLCTKNWKTLMKEIKEDTNKLEKIPCS